MSGDGGDREGFLSRWSRRKRAPEQPVAAVEQAPQAAPLPEGQVLDDLIASLPKIEDFVPGQNISVFMQAWVPADLKHAALRRMWLLDPAIRDYVSPALDYAYDYNTPGMAPGFGPIETPQEAIREVADMFDRALGKAPTESARPPEARAHDNMSQSDANDEIGMARSAASQHERAPDGPGNRVSGEETPEQGGGTVPAASVSAKSNVAPQDEKTGDTKDLRRSARRHGGALPS